MSVLATLHWKNPRLWLFLFTLALSLWLLRENAHTPLYHNAERMIALGSVAVIESDREAVRMATEAFDAAQAQELTNKLVIERQAASALVVLLIIATFPRLRFERSVWVIPVPRLQTALYAFAALIGYPWLVASKGFRDMDRMYFPQWEDGLHVVLSMLMLAAVVISLMLLPFFISLARGEDGFQPVEWRSPFRAKTGSILVSSLGILLCLALLLGTSLALRNFSYVDAGSAWLLALFFFYFIYSPYRQTLRPRPG